MTQSILKRCKAIAPELLNQNGEFEVLSVQVGLRPTRTGGARVETEWIDDVGNRASKFVCHNYGHHGAGYAPLISYKYDMDRILMSRTCSFEESFGTAKTVVELVTRELAK